MNQRPVRRSIHGSVVGVVAIVAMMALSGRAYGDPCGVVDDGTGTVNLPPPGCPHLSPDEVHRIIDGLPPGTEIHLDAILTFANVPTGYPPRVWVEMETDHVINLPGSQFFVNAFQGTVCANLNLEM